MNFTLSDTAKTGFLETGTLIKTKLLYFHNNTLSVFNFLNAFADSEVGWGGRGSGPPRPKTHKAIGFLNNPDPDPLSNHKAVIGPPAKRHYFGHPH